MRNGYCSVADVAHLVCSPGRWLSAEEQEQAAERISEAYSEINEVLSDAGYRVPAEGHKIALRQLRAINAIGAGAKLKQRDEAIQAYSKMLQGLAEQPDLRLKKAVKQKTTKQRRRRSISSTAPEEKEDSGE